MTQPTFTSEEELRGVFFESGERFAHSLVQNAIYMGSQADVDGNKSVSDAELHAILAATQTEKDDYCVRSGNAQRYPATDSMFRNLQIAGANPESAEGQRAITEVSDHLLGLVKGKMNSLERLAAPSAETFRENVAKALQDPMLREASQKIVLARSFEPEVVCPSAGVEKASKERQK